METQLELPTGRAPNIRPEDVQRLVAELEKCEGWATAEELAGKMSTEEDKVTDRKVRKIASAAMPQVVSYPGSPGYRLFQKCTVAEILHCIASFDSQAREMKIRAQLYTTAYHRGYRGQPSTPASHAQS